MSSPGPAPSLDGDSLPTGDAKVAAVRDMFDRIAPRYDLVNRIMTGGLDVGWRRRMVRELHLPPRATVVDVACGTGDLCRELARAGLRPIGVDLSHNMLRHARTTAPLVLGDALALPLPDGSVDGLTCGFALRNVADLAAFATEAARVLRPEGRIGLLEVAEPEGRLTRAGHALYFGRVVPWIGGRLSDRQAYRYLPRSVAYLPLRGELLALFRGAGFELHRRLVGFGAAQLLIGTRLRL